MTMCSIQQPNRQPDVQKLDGLGLPEGYPLDDQREITPRQVKAMVDGGEDFVLIDCRTAQENQLVRIADSKLVPLQDLIGRLQELRGLQDKKIVVYCHHGVRSSQMTIVLRSRGFPNVWSMVGGIDLWAVDIDPTLTRY